jgi:hypothetical protein
MLSILGMAGQRSWQLFRERSHSLTRTVMVCSPAPSVTRHALPVTPASAIMEHQTPMQDALQASRTDQQWRSAVTRRPARLRVSATGPKDSSILANPLLMSMMTVAVMTGLTKTAAARFRQAQTPLNYLSMPTPVAHMTLPMVSGMVRAARP